MTLPIDISSNALPGLPLFYEWDWLTNKTAVIVFIALLTSLAIYFLVRAAGVDLPRVKMAATTMLACMIVLPISAGIDALYDARAEYIGRSVEATYGITLTDENLDTIVGEIKTVSNDATLSVPVVIEDEQGNLKKIDVVMDLSEDTLGLFNGPTELPRTNH